jgi:hypothetical protein
MSDSLTVIRATEVGKKKKQRSDLIEESSVAGSERGQNLKEKNVADGWGPLFKYSDHSVHLFSE